MNLQFLRYINFLCNKKQKNLLFFFSFLTFLLTLLEMIGLGLIPISIGTLMNVEEYNRYLPEILIFNSFINKSQLDQFIFLSFIIIAIFFAKNIFAFLIIFFEGKLFRNIKTDNANKLYNLYVNLPIIHHYNYNIATIMKNVVAESRISSEFINSISVVIRELFLFTGLMALMIIFNPSIAFSILLAGIFLSSIYLLVIKKKLLSETKTAERIREYQIKNINQVFSSLKETRILNTTKFFIKEFFGKTFLHENSYFILNIFNRIPKLIFEFLVVSGILLFSIYLLKRGYNLESLLPILGLIVVVAVRLLPSFNAITGAITALKRYEVSVKIIMEEFNKFKKINIKDYNKKHNAKIVNFNESLKLKDISFTFPNENKNLFKNCSIEINKGEKIGIVGPSGSGKSTLLNIILGLLKPSSGKVLVDDEDIHNNINSWHLKIGYIPQEIYLLDDTITKNVALGLSEEKEDLTKVEQALKHAELFEFSKGLKNGLDTKVGDRGVRFSGGQRQRVGIARALYRDPSILIFDEATSALDDETEKKFIDNIFTLPQEKTLILSTHKIEILSKCDRIYEIRNNNLAIYKSSSNH